MTIVHDQWHSHNLLFCCSCILVTLLWRELWPRGEVFSRSVMYPISVCDSVFVETGLGRDLAVTHHLFLLARFCITLLAGTALWHPNPMALNVYYIGLGCHSVAYSIGIGHYLWPGGPESNDFLLKNCGPIDVRRKKFVAYSTLCESAKKNTLSSDLLSSYPHSEKWTLFLEFLDKHVNTYRNLGPPVPPPPPGP